MQKKYIQIDVPKPCHENFEKMTPVERGRFCSSCEKVVLDFTYMTDGEIAKVYKENNGKICGRFLNSQLNRDINLSVPSVNSYRSKAAGILLSGVLTAGTATAQNNPVPTEPIENPRVIGEVAMNHQENKNSLTNSSEKITIKLIITEEGTGEALIGVNVILKGTSIGTVSDVDGSAELTIDKSHFKDGKIILDISYVGYESKQVPFQINNIEKDANIPIIMLEDLSCVTLGIVVTSYRHRTVYDIIKGFFKKRKHKREERKARKKERRATKAAEKLALQEQQKSKSTSNSKVITLPKPEYSVQLNNIFPNPFFNEIKLEVDAQEEADIYISIFETTGRKVYQATQRVVSGKQNITLHLQNVRLTNAEYILQLKDKNGQIQNRKIIRVGAEDLKSKD